MRITSRELRRIIREEVEAAAAEAGAGEEQEKPKSPEEYFKQLEKNPHLINDPKVQDALKQFADNNAANVLLMAMKKGMTPAKAASVVNKIPDAPEGRVSEAGTRKMKDLDLKAFTAASFMLTPGLIAHPGISWTATIAGSIGLMTLGWLVDYLSQRDEIDPSERPF